MATLILEYEDRLDVIEKDCRGALHSLEVWEEDGGRTAALRFQGDALSKAYPTSVLYKGMPLEYAWTLLADREGLLSARLNGTTIWSAAAAIEGVAQRSDDPDEAALGEAAREVAEAEEARYVRFWLSAHPGVTDVPTIAQQTGSPKALVRRVLMGVTHEVQGE